METVYVMYGILICVAAKNVAADIAAKLCESVATKLEGKVLGTFGSEFCFFPVKSH